MIETQELRQAAADLLRLLDNPPDVEQPETVITHAVCAVWESWPPTLAWSEQTCESLNQLHAKVDRLMARG